MFPAKKDTSVSIDFVGEIPQSGRKVSDCRIAGIRGDNFSSVRGQPQLRATSSQLSQLSQLWK